MIIVRAMEDFFMVQSVFLEGRILKKMQFPSDLPCCLLLLLPQPSEDSAYFFLGRSFIGRQLQYIPAVAGTVSVSVPYA